MSNHRQKEKIPNFVYLRIDSKEVVLVVRLKATDDEWLKIHAEIQSDRFAERLAAILNNRAEAVSQ